MLCRSLNRLWQCLLITWLMHPLAIIPLTWPNRGVMTCFSKYNWQFPFVCVRMCYISHLLSHVNQVYNIITWMSAMLSVFCNTFSQVSLIFQFCMMIWKTTAYKRMNWGNMWMCCRSVCYTQQPCEIFGKTQAFIVTVLIDFFSCLVFFFFLQPPSLKWWTIRTMRTWMRCVRCVGTKSLATTMGSSHARAARCVLLYHWMSACNHLQQEGSAMFIDLQTARQVCFTITPPLWFNPLCVSRLNFMS